MKSYNVIVSFSDLYCLTTSVFAETKEEAEKKAIDSFVRNHKEKLSAEAVEDGGIPDGYYKNAPASNCYSHR